MIEPRRHQSVTAIELSDASLMPFQGAVALRNVSNMSYRTLQDVSQE